jgi:hypothetical protein
VKVNIPALVQLAVDCGIELVSNEEGSMVGLFGTGTVTEEWCLVVRRHKQELLPDLRSLGAIVRGPTQGGMK